MTSNYTDVNSLSSAITASRLRRRWCFKSIKQLIVLAERRERRILIVFLPPEKSVQQQQPTLEWIGGHEQNEKDSETEIHEQPTTSGVAGAEVFTRKAKMLCKSIANVGYSIVAGCEVDLSICSSGSESFAESSSSPAKEIRGSRIE
jgi:hypothetical protein